MLIFQNIPSPHPQRANNIAVLALGSHRPLYFGAVLYLQSHVGQLFVAHLEQSSLLSQVKHFFVRHNIIITTAIISSKSARPANTLIMIFGSGKSSTVIKSENIIYFIFIPICKLFFYWSEIYYSSKLQVFCTSDIFCWLVNELNDIMKYFPWCLFFFQRKLQTQILFYLQFNSILLRAVLIKKYLLILLRYTIYIHT